MISIAEPQRPALSSVTTSQFRSREALRPIVSLSRWVLGGGHGEQLR